MKKSLLLSLVCCSFMYAAGFVNPLPVSSKALENGGTLSAIDAYQDGVGAMVVENGRGIDNSAMNKLVFKYGNAAKDSLLSVGDEVLLNGTPEDKLLAGKLYPDGGTCTDGNNLTQGETWLSGVCQGGLIPNGISCSDNLSNTINDQYFNQICVGKIVTNPSCSDTAMVWNTTTKICEKGGISTYSGTYNNSYSCPSGGILSGTTCLNASTVYSAGRYLAWWNSNGFGGWGSSDITACWNSDAGATRYPENGTSTIYGYWVQCKFKNYTCHLGGSLSGSTCTLIQNTTATNTPYYTCPSGGNLSGSTCTVNTYQSAPGICQTGYTLTNNQCIQN